MSWFELKNVQEPNDFEDDEFASIHTIVLDNVKILTQNFQVISQDARAISTDKDSEHFRSALKSKIKNSTTLMKETQSQIIKLLKLSGTTGDPHKRSERKQNVERWCRDLETFFENLKQLAQIANEKMKDIPVQYSTQTPSSKPSTSTYPYEDDDINSSKGDERQRQKFARLDADREYQDKLIQERDKEIRIIQTQMIELNDIFKSLAQLVEEQGEMVDNIQSNISSANINVQIGTLELKEADKIQEGTNYKLCLLAICCTITIMIVVVIVVLLIKKIKNSYWSEYSY